MADRFYVSFPPLPGRMVLQGPEARHLATVLRAKTGDRVVLFCGNGAEYPAEVVEVSKRDVTLEVEEPSRPERELPFHLEVAAAFPKGDRGEFMIEKLTELGVTRFVPLVTQRSVVHPRLEKLQRMVIEASKQCGRNMLMEISAAMEWKNYCKLTVLPKRKLIAHPSGEANRWISDGDKRRFENMVIAIGPEGGWTDDEVENAAKAGWQPVGLGPRILRIETAAIALASYFALSSSTSA